MSTVVCRSGFVRRGERLSAEKGLLTEYEVSRPVLREAVRVLVAKGLVLSRQRAGAVVKPRNEWRKAILAALLNRDALAAHQPRWCS